MQIAYYDGFRLQQQQSSKLVGTFIMVVLIVIALAPLVVLTKLFDLDWLDYLYLLSYIKIMVTLIKYIPQVVLNFRRQSTVGWSTSARRKTSSIV